MDFQQIRDFVNPAVAQATGLQEVENLSMPVPVAYVPVQLVIDGALSLTSENPVQNKVIAVAIQNLDGRITAVEGQFAEGVTEAVNNWLAAHPEATTTVQDGAITYAKLDTNLKGEVDQISELKSALVQSELVANSIIQNNGYYKIVPVSGEFVNRDTGSFQPSTNWSRTHKLPCNGVDKIYIKSSYTGPYNVWYDENGNYISSFAVPVNTTGKGTEFTVPNGACFFALSAPTANISATEVQTNGLKGIDNSINNAKVEAESNLADIYQENTILDPIAGYYVDKTTGEIKESSGWNMSKKILCYGFDSIVINSGVTSDYNGFYEANGTFISAFTINIQGTPITVPNNAFYYIISQNQSYWDSIKIPNPLRLSAVSKKNIVSSDITFRFQNAQLSKLNNDLMFTGSINGYSVENGNFAYSLAQLKALFPSDVLGDYIKIGNWYAWCYNVKTKVIEKVYYNAITLNHIVLIRNVDGNLTDCKLRESLAEEASVSYLTDHFDTPIKKIIDMQNGDSISLVFMTDNHHRQVGNQVPAVRSIKKILDNCEIKAIISGGDDIVDTLTSLDTEVSYMREIMNSFYALGAKTLPVVGNHDDLSFQSVYNTIQQSDVTDFCIKPQLMNTLLMKRSDDYIFRDDENILKNCYYYDIPHTDIRILCLNTSDVPYDLYETKIINGISTKVYKYPAWNTTVISGEQANFVADMLSEYNGKLIVVSHVPLALMKGNSMPINGDCIVEILEAWKNGTSVSYEGTNPDFPCSVSKTFSGTHTVIGAFGGHTHYDNLVTNNGITYVSTLNCSCDQWSDSPERVAGTYSEIAFDVITVFPTERVVKLTRFGAGTDREFTY